LAKRTIKIATSMFTALPNVAIRAGNPSLHPRLRKKLGANA
jgi:hypothetical protein